MNWKLIFLLSLPAIPIAFAGVYGFASNFEQILWLVLFVVYGMIIVRRTSGKHFRNAWMVSVVNGVWIGLIHGGMFDTYMANNPEMMSTFNQMPHIGGGTTTIMVMGPVFGALFGLVGGLIAVIVGKVMKKKVAQSTPVS